MTRPTLYRKKPAIIEAVALTPENVHDVATWCGGRVVEKGSSADPSDVYLALDIPTLEGVMRAETRDTSGLYSHGDWVVKNDRGAFSRCKPDIFAATYEEVKP